MPPVARFPFPMPFGWFKVALADDVPAGAVITRHYFGTELVVWRDDEGRVACQEAYCPHLGAHLGWGGKVEGQRIRCPFHGWVFDCDGNNVEILVDGKTYMKRCGTPSTSPARGRNHFALSSSSVGIGSVYWIRAAR